MLLASFYDNSLTKALLQLVRSLQSLLTVLGFYNLN
jgi:hypothetical protein